MTPAQTLRVVPIVEGRGEPEAVRLLLYRIWTELLGRTFVRVERPIRHPRDALVSEDGIVLRNAATYARNRLLASATEPFAFETRLVLLVVDADKACPATLGPAVLRRLQAHVGPDVPAACVLAKRRYETWLVGGSDDMLDVFGGVSIPDEPEEVNAGKRWVAEHLVDRPSYKETVDQARLTNRMNLAKCRERCPSFDKLCRELERLQPS